MSGLGLGGAVLRLDMRAALEMAQLEGCDRQAVGPLLRAIGEGLALAQMRDDSLSGAAADGGARDGE